MTQAVVDILEAVEIDKQHCQPQFTGDSALQVLLKQVTVGQVGEWVVISQMAEFLLREFNLLQ